MRRSEQLFTLLCASSAPPSIIDSTATGQIAAAEELQPGDGTKKAYLGHNAGKVTREGDGQNDFAQLGEVQIAA